MSKKKKRKSVDSWPPVRLEDGHVYQGPNKTRIK